MFLAMVGSRFNPGKREVRITCDRFPNRIENKKYTIIQLERLIIESKRIFHLQSEERKQLRDNTDNTKKKNFTPRDVSSGGN
jgi:hypothetical protein